MRLFLEMSDTLRLQVPQGPLVKLLFSTIVDEPGDHFANVVKTS